MTQNELLAEIEKLKAVNAELKSRAEASKRPGTLTLRVSAKQGLSLYGLGRFPLTLYKEQWIRVLDFADQIRAFIKANDDQLSTKADKAA